MHEQSGHPVVIMPLSTRLISAYLSQEVGFFLPLPSEDEVVALFEENEMLYAAIIFQESESLTSKVRPDFLTTSSFKFIHSTP